MAQSRTRNWAFLMYHDELGALDIASLADRSERLGVKIAACKHACDVMQDGSPKKPHTHVVVAYEGVKSLSQVQEDWADCAANGVVVPVRNLNASLRYLTHEDNVDKYHYQALDLCLGFTDDNFAKKGKGSDLQAFNEVLDWVNETGCISTAALIDYARTEQPAWLDLLLKSNYFMLVSAYIRSSYWSANNI